MNGDTHPSRKTLHRGLVLGLAALLAGCETDEFWVASDGCPSSTGAHDEPGDDCVTGECEEPVSIEALAEIQAGPAAPPRQPPPRTPPTLAQEPR